MDEISTSRFNGPEYGCVLGRVSDPDLVFLPALDPLPVFKSLDQDPVEKFLWIRIRCQPGSLEQKGCKKGSKSDLIE